MPAHNTTPGSSSTEQHTAINRAGYRRGLSVDDLRAMTPTGSLRALSSYEAHLMLCSLRGLDPNVPFERKQPRRSRPRGIAMITDAHVSQIERLGADVFRDQQRFENWLRDRFNVSDIRALATAERAGQCIFQLRQMWNNQQPAWSHCVGATPLRGASAF